MIYWKFCALRLIFWPGTLTKKYLYFEVKTAKFVFAECQMHWDCAFEIFCHSFFYQTIISSYIPGVIYPSLFFFCVAPHIRYFFPIGDNMGSSSAKINTRNMMPSNVEFEVTASHDKVHGSSSTEINARIMMPSNVEFECSLVMWNKNNSYLKLEARLDKSWLAMLEGDNVKTPRSQRKKWERE